MIEIDNLDRLVDGRLVDSEEPTPLPQFNDIDHRGHDTEQNDDNNNSFEATTEKELDSESNNENNKTGRYGHRHRRKSSPVPDQLRLRMKKTKFCRWVSQGKCERGNACFFAHSKAELRGLPDLRLTRICLKFEQTGSCTAGSRCRFAHNEQELRCFEDALINTSTDTTKTINQILATRSPSTTKDDKESPNTPENNSLETTDEIVHQAKSASGSMSEADGDEKASINLLQGVARRKDSYFTPFKGISNHTVEDQNIHSSHGSFQTISHSTVASATRSFVSDAGVRDPASDRSPCGYFPSYSPLTNEDQLFDNEVHGADSSRIHHPHSDHMKDANYFKLSSRSTLEPTSRINSALYLPPIFPTTSPFPAPYMFTSRSEEQPNLERLPFEQEDFSPVLLSPSAVSSSLRERELAPFMDPSPMIRPRATSFRYHNTSGSNYPSAHTLISQQIHADVIDYDNTVRTATGDTEEYRFHHSTHNIPDINNDNTPIPPTRLDEPLHSAPQSTLNNSLNDNQDNYPWTSVDGGNVLSSLTATNADNFIRDAGLADTDHPDVDYWMMQLVEELASSLPAAVVSEILASSPSMLDNHSDNSANKGPLKDYMDSYQCDSDIERLIRVTNAKLLSSEISNPPSNDDNDLQDA